MSIGTYIVPQYKFLEVDCAAVRVSGGRLFRSTRFTFAYCDRRI